MNYYIIFPRGDRTKLSTLELSDNMLYELNDYAVASRKSFLNEQDCILYAKALAQEHNITYVGDSEGYLD